MPEIEVIRTRSLGDNSYLLVAGDEAAVVDPQRDCWQVLRSCEERGIAIRYTLETHVHNDYVSGAMEVRAETGARVVAPARGRYTFDHLAVDDGDEIEMGGLKLSAMATPGHTPEHLAYVVREAAVGPPVAIFTGGSLMVGSAGRTDLLGNRVAGQLARDQYRSLASLSAFPESTRVLPTHGSGSFCGTTSEPGSAAAEPTGSVADVISTIGRERATNPAMWFPDAETFARVRLANLPPYPAYYRHMAPLNRSGAMVLGGLPLLKPLSPQAVRALCDDGAWVVDGRDRRSFAAAHLPGALNIELDDEFASFVGWAVPFDARLVLVLPEQPASAAGAPATGDPASGDPATGDPASGDPAAGDPAAEAARQLLRIGYDRVAGYLAGGVEKWLHDGGPVRSYPTVTAAQLAEQCGPDTVEVHDADIQARELTVLDVRTPQETRLGQIPGSVNVFVGDLPRHLFEIPRDRPVWTVCASGRRAAMAASLLDRDGITVTAVTSGGVTDVLAATHK